MVSTVNNDLRVSDLRGIPGSGRAKSHESELRSIVPPNSCDDFDLAFFYHTAKHQKFKAQDYAKSGNSPLSPKMP